MESIQDWSRIPDFLVNFLKTAGEVARQRSQNVFVVGGFVRDLLLGVSNLDVDLVAEGDGVSYAEALAGKLGGRFHRNDKFGTAVVLLPQELKVDVAGARKEFYPHPAALPQVSQTSISRDLFRRDFSINAMAVKLNPPNFGELLDPFAGRKDLEDGVVRMLHDLSFVDDPTRIFRAIRFEQRYRFRMDSHTEQRLKDAIRSGAIGGLSMDRTSGELTLILAEQNPLPAVKRMADLKMLSLIHPSLALSDTIRAVMENILQVLKEFQEVSKDESIESWLVYGIALLSELNPEEVTRVMETLRWTARQKEKLFFLFSNSKGVFEKLGTAKTVTSSEIAAALESVSTEGLLFLYAGATSVDMRHRIRKYLTVLRKMKPLLTGEDLARLGLPPGPRYRELLAQTRRDQLDGILKSKEEAVERIRKGGVH